MVKEDYVSFETAKLLEEKGFDWNCESKRFYPEPDYYQESPNGVSAPTLQMVMKWLREVHNLFIEIMVGDNDGRIWYDFDVINIGKKDMPIVPIDDTVELKTYEEACEVAIKYCLENLI